MTTLEEIIRFAVQREEAAYRLYKSAAEKSTSIAARKMFEEMAAEEAGHKEVFSRVEVAEAVGKMSARQPDMKLAEYLAEIPLKPDMTYDEILRYGIKTEESAYRLYLAAADMTDDPKLRKILESFAQVELGHKKKLEEVYDERVLTEM
ncbi:ferritin family protein [Geobacter sp. DSM 9736]|uniref:ferritin family protein n=1 Tax=Geobacter sp. DSM 9736 TaxID=1277350 RepID=UPI000B5126BB|nr:ferritin family protein [Geobacter sp. DSM 9736]SNB46573.1 Rubrerythrin [Geobacter sp. DSM 9736]